MKYYCQLSKIFFTVFTGKFNLIFLLDNNFDVNLIKVCLMAVNSINHFK